MAESGRSVEAQKKVSDFSEKVCFICGLSYKEIDDKGIRKHGYNVYLVDLSKLGEGDGSSSSIIGDFKLKPSFKIQFEIGMSVSALGSTIYFTDTLYTMGCGMGEIPIPKVYSLDIQTLNQNQFEFCAADFCTLPSMWGIKYRPLITSIPSTKKILVFSSRFIVQDSFPVYYVYDDFEMYDVETNSWEKLPQFLLRENTGLSYFLHLSHVDERAIEISLPGPRYLLKHQPDKCDVYRYTFIDEGAVFLVQLSCGVKLTLYLNSPSNGWQLYRQDKVHTSIPYKYHIQRGDGIFDNVSFPQSSFGKDDLVKHQSSMVAALDGENRVCIVQVAISRGSKHGRVIMDVASPEAENPLASCRYVVEEKLKRLFPVDMFVYQPKCP